MIAMGHRLRRNAWGPYYVTDECDGCGLCGAYALANFDRSPDGSYYYVIQQPYDEWEDNAIRDAMKACPQRCIRDDGGED